MWLARPAAAVAAGNQCFSVTKVGIYDNRNNNNKKNYDDDRKTQRHTKATPAVSQGGVAVVRLRRRVSVTGTLRHALARSLSLAPGGM